MVPLLLCRPAHGVGTAAGFGEAGWTCWLEDLRLELRVETVDPALPALQDIIDPVAARDLLQQVIVDAGYADAAVTTCRPHVVRYKPGSRCTVVVEVDYDHANGNRPGPDPIVIKTHQGDKGQTAWAAMTALWQSPLARQGIVTLAEPLGYEPERRILFQGPIPEDCTLKELARRAIADGSDGQLDRLREELVRDRPRAGCFAQVFDNLRGDGDARRRVDGTSRGGQSAVIQRPAHWKPLLSRC